MLAKAIVVNQAGAKAMDEGGCALAH